MKQWLLGVAYPDVKCEDCIGADCGRTQPCWCIYHDCWKPNTPTPWYIKLLRKVLDFT